MKAWIFFIHSLWNDCVTLLQSHNSSEIQVQPVKLDRDDHTGC